MFVFFVLNSTGIGLSIRLTSATIILACHFRLGLRRRVDTFEAFYLYLYLYIWPHIVYVDVPVLRDNVSIITGRISTLIGPDISSTSDHLINVLPSSR